MEYVHLQGIGKVPAKRVADLKLGDVLMWNYGSTSKVVGLVPSKSGKTVTVATQNEHGDLFSRTRDADTLLAVVDQL